MFFRAKPNVSDAVKARIEFYFQQVVECIGLERMRRSVLSRQHFLDRFESDPTPSAMITFIGDQLQHNTSGLKSRLELKQGASCNSGGCGGGSCGGPSGFQGSYHPQIRTIVLDSDIHEDPNLGLATLVHFVVQDLIQQSGFDGALVPELVEVAVVASGLGMLRNHAGLVGKSASHWDSTRWEVAPRPFLDGQALAYANALAAWTREDASPEWLEDLPAELKRPTKNSLKFLFKTGDSFIEPMPQTHRLDQPQESWWRLAASSFASSQIIALRHLHTEGGLSDSQEALMLERLRSGNRFILLHAIAAAERLAVYHRDVATPEIVQGLKALTEHRDDEVRAKAMCVVARLELVDDLTVETASNMLESSSRHVIFASAMALATQDSIPDHTMKLIDRCFKNSLRSCDYEFVELFCNAYGTWLDDPKGHLETLLGDSPEYLPIVLESLNRPPDNVVGIAS